MQSAQIIRNGRRLIASRDKILAGQGGQLREVIAASWQRSMAHGLLPDRYSVPYVGPAPSGALADAAGPT